MLCEQCIILIHIYKMHIIFTCECVGPVYAKHFRNRLKSFLHDCTILGSGSDFFLMIAMGVFQPGETRTCTNVTILVDNVVEGTENFTVTLTGNSYVVVSNTASTATVFIDDDDVSELVYNHTHVYII